MPTEFSNYIETRQSAGGTLDGSELLIASKNGESVSFTTQELIDEVAGGGGGAVDFVDKETPSGSINGSNTAFTLANTPVAGSEHIYLNGILLESGGGNDYTISGANITMLTAPVSGDRLKASYRI